MDLPVGLTSGPRLVVEAMPQLVDAQDPVDDWTGMTSAARRRKLQNRLNQRAHRRRMQGQADTTVGASSHTPGLAVDSEVEVIPRRETEAQEVVLAGASLLVAPERRARVYTFTQRAYADYMFRCPRPAHLSILVRINILNAVARNATALGFPIEMLCHDESVSPFNQQGPHLPSAPVPLPSCPATLRPTPLQLTMAHHPWIDLFPVARMRDNVLRAVALGLLDEDELCADLVNTDEGHTEGPSLIVWGESWDPSGWEATVPFVRKWGWLMQGCPELLVATNAWRERRGERRLGFGV